MLGLPTSTPARQLWYDEGLLFLRWPRCLYETITPGVKTTSRRYLIIEVGDKGLRVIGEVGRGLRGGR